jgi:hypothetical protein
MIELTEHQKTVKMLIDAGYESGWALLGNVLTIWEHEENPPKPLTRPA